MSLLEMSRRMICIANQDKFVPSVISIRVVWTIELFLCSVLTNPFSIFIAQSIEKGLGGGCYFYLICKLENGSKQRDTRWANSVTQQYVYYR